MLDFFLCFEVVVVFGGVGAGGAGSSDASSSSEDEDSLSLDVSELEKANAAGLCLCGREGAALSTELASASDDKLSASARFICREDMVRVQFYSVLPPCFGEDTTMKTPKTNKIACTFPDNTCYTATPPYIGHHIGHHIVGHSTFKAAGISGTTTSSGIAISQSRSRAPHGRA